MIKIADTNIRVLGPVSGLNYYDTQTVALPDALSPLEAWNAIMAHPQPFLRTAFKIRDAVSSKFGVKRIGGFSGERKDHVSIGEYLDFFLVEYTDENSLVLTERDRHLDVMTCVSIEAATVSVTSSVRVHNLFGHIYMIPVGLAHRWIVRGMLKRLKQSTTT